MGIRGINALIGGEVQEEPQVLLVNVYASAVDPERIAELLTRAGYNVESVEAERGGTWAKP
jgi:hypothetical protein